MRFSLILLLFATLFACKQQNGELAEVTPPELPPYKISIDSLVRQAEGLGAIFGEATTKGRSVRAAGVVAMDDILFSKGATKSVGSSANTPKAYVVNYANDGGFAILADDRRLATNVLAYSESGNVDATTDNEGLLFYMSMADEYLAAEGRSLGLGDDFPPSLPFDYTPNFSVAPYDWGSTNGTPYRWRYMEDGFRSRKPKLLSTNWGQYLPYNMFTPIVNELMTPTGCVATAIVQIMSYYNKPSSIKYFADGQTYHIDWALAKQGNVIGANIPYLMRDVGEKVKMEYKPEGSDAYSKDIPNALRQYGYSCSEFIGSEEYGFRGYYDPNVAISEIDNNRPVYMQGLPRSGYGHCWVIDGYLVKSSYWAEAIDYVIKDNLDRLIVVGQRVVKYEGKESPKTYYMHINWGFDGYNNGFFYAFDNKDAYSYDGTNNPYHNNYIYDFGMITNIH